MEFKPVKPECVNIAFGDKTTEVRLAIDMDRLISFYYDTGSNEIVLKLKAKVVDTTVNK